MNTVAILIVLLIILVLFFGRQGGGGWRGRCGPGCRCPRCAENFTASESVMSPYTPLNMQDGALRGARFDGFGQEHPYLRADLAKNYRNWATSPNDIEQAQRSAWFQAVAGGNREHFEPGGGVGDAVARYHTPGSSIDYQQTLVDLVADPRMRAQQDNWYSEVAPKSQTSLKVDTLDEAAAVSNYRGHGIYAFRFDAPSQHNPLFITDQDATTYGPNATKFSFGE